MTKHNTKSPQRRAEPRAAELASEIRKRFAGSTNIHEEGLEFIYLQTRRLNVVERDRVLAALTGPGRDQYAAYRARRDREEFAKHQAARDANRRPAKAQGGNVAAVVPPVGSVGPIEVSPVQRPGESFSDYLSRISERLRNPDPEEWGLVSRMAMRYGPGGVSMHRAGSAAEMPLPTPRERLLPFLEDPRIVDEGPGRGGILPRVELTARARDELAAIVSDPSKLDNVRMGPYMGRAAVSAFIVDEKLLRGHAVRIVDETGRSRLYPLETIGRAHETLVELADRMEEAENKRRAKSRAQEREIRAVLDSGPKSTLVEAFKMQDDLKGLADIMRGIAAGVRVLSPRQRRKLERMAPDLYSEIRKAERASTLNIGGAGIGN